MNREITPSKGQAVEPEGCSWSGDPHKIASELRRIANTWRPGFRLPQLLRDAADEIDSLTTPALTVVPDALLEAIPELVYYSAEGGNFYGMVSRRGQGQEFFDKWFPRRAEFPTSPADKAASTQEATDRVEAQ